MREQEGLFSVVIPAYNREKTIHRAIKSAINQTYTNIEIIVVDDGSTDSTKEVVAGLQQVYPISYFWQKNGGAQKARNTGLAQAIGEYIIFLDSDDELSPDCLYKMIERYSDDRELGAVYCLTGKKNDSGEILLARSDYLEGYVYKEVLEQGYLTSTSFISMRKKVFERIGGWDEQFPASQDDDICFRIAKYFKIGLIKEMLGYYWMDAGIKKKIGGSPKRVAMGWWLLWNKYEDDTFKYCGKETIVKHYSECARRFAYTGDKKLLNECMAKIYWYSGNTCMTCLRIKYIVLRVYFSIRKKVKSMIVK